MQGKVLVALFAVFIQTAIARRCRMPPPISPIYDIPTGCGLPNHCYEEPIFKTMAPIADCGLPCCNRAISLPTACRSPLFCAEPILDCGCRKTLYNEPILECGFIEPTCYDWPIFQPITEVCSCKSIPSVGPIVDCRCGKTYLNEPTLDCNCMTPTWYDGPIIQPTSGYPKPVCGGCGKTTKFFEGQILDCAVKSCDGVPFKCGVKKCSKELVLPPLRAEIPQDLGYFPAAVPLVSTFFTSAIDAGVCSGASVPVTSPCSCLALAAPVCPDIAPLVAPIIL